MRGYEMFVPRLSLALLMLVGSAAYANQANADDNCHRRPSYQQSYRVVPSQAQRYYSRQPSQQRYSLFSQPQRSQRVSRPRVYGSDYVGNFADSNFNGSVDAFEANYGGAPGLFW